VAGLNMPQKKCPQNDIFAIDLLDMKPVKNVSFFKSDIREIDQVEPIFTKKGSFDLVISDLAPNISGIGAIDNESILELNMLTLEIAVNLSKTQSKFLVKTFQNSNFKYFRSFMEKNSV
jgi:23S rRNA (uridine2552-2'-O)-methyltransferase